MEDTLTKFSDPYKTAKGEERAFVNFAGFETLWFNTGSLCNLRCDHCYMESSPTNDRLLYLTFDEVKHYVDQSQQLSPAPQQIAFTGGEPFMNPDMVQMCEYVCDLGLNCLVLSNAMKPLEKHKDAIKQLSLNHGKRFQIRVSLDHYTEAGHDAERGKNSFSKTMQVMSDLSADGVSLSVAGRAAFMGEEQEAQARQHYGQVFAECGIGVDSTAKEELVLFPEMESDHESLPEITTQCWDILGKKSSDMMCAHSRMVIKRKGDAAPSVAACTLLPYDDFFNLGTDLEKSLQPVHLKHRYCAQFCVLGGASCTA